MGNVVNIREPLLGKSDEPVAQVSVRDRLLEFIRSEGMTKKEFEQRVGLSGSYLINLKRMPSHEVLSRIFKSFPHLSVEWLLTGVGKMLRGSSRTQSEVRYYPHVDSMVSGVDFLDDPTEAIETMVIPGVPAGCFALKMTGDSMSPLISQGDMVFMSEWKESFIHWGRVYMIVTQGGYRMIRRLREVEGVEGELRCESCNPDRGAFNIKRDDIVRLFLVRGLLSIDAF